MVIRALNEPDLPCMYNTEVGLLHSEKASGRLVVVDRRNDGVQYLE